MSWSTVWHSNCVRTNQTVCKIRKYDESADSFMEYIILWHNDCLSNMPCVRNGPFKYKKICKTRNLVKIACRKWILYSNTFLFDVKTFDIRYWYWTGFAKWFSLTPICDGRMRIRLTFSLSWWHDDTEPTCGEVCHHGSHHHYTAATE